MTGEAAEWRPTAGLAALKRRAAMLAELRAFFTERGVLEVETPLLSAETTPDLHLEPMSSRVDAPGVECRRMYLQTSPELAMKRLLAAGSGSIYQVCKAFRGGERGRWHNPEFTILEWYRVGWDVHRLMREVAALIETLLARSRRLKPATYNSYADLMQRHAGIDPHEASIHALRRSVADGRSPVDTGGLDRDDLLSRLFGERVEPRFAPDRVTVVFGYPASQAAMARLNASDPRTAERFEAYVGEIELANGYGELCDPAEQRQRLERDLASRRGTGRPPLPMPSRFLAALESGLPHCAGVALGLDRLLGLDLQAGSIDELIAFPVERA
ncbi:MAG: EF-P lysine aminoacylase GenX [Holophagales bacterium]|nr:EF-P lysine aminoacylase GenX [Holophagales bacterium]MYG29092.1 EF-P lysine aminoacylase GenX [Holophagales bacterium]MYI80588.1 EF-P lysine aminoacylase GenX [Holophagales bacterium]